MALLLSLWVHVVLYSGDFLTKTTAAPSQEVVEGGGVMIFFEKNKVLGVEPNRVLNIIRRNLKNKHDLKRVGVKKDVRPCICLYIDNIFTWIVTRRCDLTLPY